MHITIIEDERVLSSNVAKKLKRNGYNTKIINSFAEFMNNSFEESDLFIIDISLRDGSGFDIIKNIREKKKVNSPIIITSGYNDVEKKIYGLDIGADDYLSKPFSSEELMARIRVLIRRTNNSSSNSNIEYKNIIYDISKKRLSKNGIEILLTPRETQLIEFILLNVGELITKSELINSVWGEYDISNISDNNINVTIYNLRKKIGDDFNLKTFAGKGYILEK